MTASLPVPHDPSSDDGARTRPAQVVPRPLPPPPVVPAAEAARRAVTDDTIAAKAPRPRKIRPPRTSASRQRSEQPAPIIGPGHPPPVPPIPADLGGFVIPPKPPLPVAGLGAAAPEIVVPPRPPAPESAPDTREPDPLVDGDTVLTPETDVKPTTAETSERRREAVASVFDSELAAPAVDVDSAALSMQGVTKVFGETRAVDGIDLVVPTGVFYGLVGPNGAGKTTTLSMIAGLLRPDRGAITVAGVAAAAKPRAAKKLMGVLPDRLRTFDRLTGRQLLYYCGVLRGLPPAVVAARTADLARAFDLVDALSRPVSDYSAGMTKKVMLAGAMIHSPRLLVLDEPFESVDPVSSAVILDILAAYVAHGGTVILSSHGMDLVERVCSRVAVMVAGQILAEGTIDEVRGELTLEQRFVELAGGLSDVEGLEWLHTFSG